MLSPSELFVGCLADAPGPSLVLPRTRYEHACLVTAAANPLTAICLDGDHRFWSLPCSGNTAWKGVVIPGVAIEIDETSVFDAEDLRPPLGAMVRRKTELALVAKADTGYFGNYVPIMVDLPPSREHMAAGFTRWNVILWRGDEKQVMLKVDTAVAGSR